MLYLYLDESGDLGFDFVNRRPSCHFTVAVLAVKGHENNKGISNGVKVTIRRKLKALRVRGCEELKGSNTNIELKRYFYNKVRNINFKLYVITLNKRQAYQYMVQDKARIYNYISRMALERIDLEDAKVRVILTVDKSKNKTEIKEFNAYMISQIKARLDPKIPLEIFHGSSHEILQLQAIDLFAWGIFRKYERKDPEWSDVFKEKVRFDGFYLE